MEIELSQIRNFVGACHPFELLSDVGEWRAELYSAGGELVSAQPKA